MNADLHVARIHAATLRSTSGKIRVAMNPQPSRLTLESPSARSLHAAGVIDAHTADDLSDRLDELGTDGNVHLDLSEVDFIDSSGLRALVNAHQALDGAGQQLQLSGISAAVDRLLQITGLRDHLHVV